MIPRCAKGFAFEHYKIFMKNLSASERRDKPN
jgi:hypothetical protein